MSNERLRIVLPLTTLWCLINWLCTGCLLRSLTWPQSSTWLNNKPLIDTSSDIGVFFFLAEKATSSTQRCSGAGEICGFRGWRGQVYAAVRSDWYRQWDYYGTNQFATLHRRIHSFCHLRCLRWEIICGQSDVDNGRRSWGCFIDNCSLRQIMK